MIHHLCFKTSNTFDQYKPILTCSIKCLNDAEQTDITSTSVHISKKPTTSFEVNSYSKTTVKPPIGK